MLSYSTNAAQERRGSIRTQAAVLTPAAPPQAVPVLSGFDYVTVDAQRRRVYAAHGGSRALLVVDADSGAIVGQVRVGPMHGVAVDLATGHVYTGDGDAKTVSEVDPVSLKVLRTVDVDGPPDAIAYDPATGHIYADEDDGTHVYVVDAKTFKVIKSITIPGHKPEYLAINPKTHEVYQNIDNLNEIAVIDARSLGVTRTIATPEMRHNHPLQYDAQYNQIVLGGQDPADPTKGVISAYAPDGKKLGSISAGRYDQCDLDASQHVLACAGSGGIARFQLVQGGAPKLLDTTPLNAGVHTTGIDPSNHAVWAVWADREGKGDFVQRLNPSP
jgi:hypothetical protein